MANLPKCPHCGSKNVSRVEGFYRCADCLNDFGRTPYDDNGIPMIEACSGLRIRLGDLFNGSVRLRMGQDGDVCLYEIYDSNTEQPKRKMLNLEKRQIIFVISCLLVIIALAIALVFVGLKAFGGN